MVGEPDAFVTVASAGAEPHVVPIHRRLVVGRECAGIDDIECLRIQDPLVSRWHFEIRIEPGSGAVLVDTSTNGTRVNGRRVDPASRHPLQPGDLITVGDVELEFDSKRVVGVSKETTATTRYRRLDNLVFVVGDIIGYSTITQLNDSDVVLTTIDRIFAALRDQLKTHHGTLKDYMGDALFAIWEPDRDPMAVAEAVAFTIDACRALDELAPTLPLRSPDGTPLRMGWAIVTGSAIASPLDGSQGGALVGDAVNLAFRLSGVAGRDGRDPVVATAAVVEELMALSHQVSVRNPEDVMVKGRSGTERIYGVVPAGTA